MSKEGFEWTKILILLAILAIMMYWATALNDHVDKVKSDIKTLRALLTSIPKPMQCPGPGEHTNKICRYRLQIKGPLDNHKGWFVATIPEEVIQQAKKDCIDAKAKNPEMGDHTCVDPATYTYREYAIQVDGTEPPIAVNDFVNDPVTDHLMMIVKK